ncbi:MAG: 2-phosphosulfolactate phosphatase [Clostridia bacterium]|nr:2-phosphosulfolactate phosphatase [Clostridia bacterium]
MNIRILQLVEGAQKARGLTVIIDVFRAFTVEAWLSRNHAAAILPVGDIQTALEYREAHPGTLLCGERGGRKIDGFDFGNSPSSIEHADLTGKTVVHTTSAGTQGIANANGADEIIGGALVNAKAIARYIRQKNPAEVSLVCMGLAGKEETQEDTLCARYIKSLLEDQPIADMDAEIDLLKRTSGAKFFDPAQQDVFPEADFHLSTQVDRFDFVLRYDRETGRMCRVDL